MNKTFQFANPRVRNKKFITKKTYYNKARVDQAEGPRSAYSGAAVYNCRTYVLAKSARRAHLPQEVQEGHWRARHSEVRPSGVVELQHLPTRLALFVVDSMGFMIKSVKRAARFSVLGAKSVNAQAFIITLAPKARETIAKASRSKMKKNSRHSIVDFMWLKCTDQ